MPQGISAEDFMRGGPPSPLPNQRAPTAQTGIPVDEFMSMGEVPEATAAPDEQLNFLQRVAGDVEKRQLAFGDILEAQQRGEQGVASTALQMAGKFGAGMALDVIGEGVVSGFRGLSALTPDSIENPIKDLASNAAHGLLNTDLGQAGLEAAEKGFESWVGFKEENPTIARNIESLVNVGLLFAPIKGKPKTPTTPVGELGQQFTASGARITAQNRASFVDDLVQPLQTVRQKVSQVGTTTEEGILRAKQPALASVDRSAANAVTGISGVTSRNSLQANHTAINQALGVEARRLSASLADDPARYPRAQFTTILDDAATRMADSPLLVGDAGRAATRVVDKMEELARANPNSAAGLLKARQQLDNWIRNQKGDNIFDPNLENALSISVREARQATNHFIGTVAPQANVRKSLNLQSSFYRAMDNIAPKAAREGDNIALRAWRNVLKVLPIRGQGNQVLALAFGVGGLGASAMFAPFVTALAGVAGLSYVGSRAVMSAKSRNAIGALLNQIDNAIRKTSDANLIRTLRADRAALRELVNTAEKASTETSDGS